MPGPGRPPAHAVGIVTIAAAATTAAAFIVGCERLTDALHAVGATVAGFVVGAAVAIRSRSDA